MADEVGQEAVAGLVVVDATRATSLAIPVAAVAAAAAIVSPAASISRPCGLFAFSSSAPPTSRTSLGSFTPSTSFGSFAFLCFLPIVQSPRVAQT